MPREVLHWEILAEALRRCGSTAEMQPIADLCGKEWSAAYLGALAPDAPYFYRFGGSSFEHLAESLHGLNGEDTYKPVTAMIRAVISTSKIPPAAQFSLILGYISHCIVDMHFHPMIYYFTGNYYDLDMAKRAHARANHRLFEVHLDSYWKATFPCKFETRLHKIWSALGSKKAPLIELLTKATPPSTEYSWQGAYDYYSFLQRVFLNQSAGALSYFLKPLIGEGSQAMFSYGRGPQKYIFDAPLKFLNPASGEEQLLTVHELRELAVAECLTEWRKLLPILSGNFEALESILATFRGRSLNAGIYGAKKEDMRYFAEVL